MFNLDKEAEIFEFIENMYLELTKQDNGYYPTKHDKIVFEIASKEFGLHEQELREIYDKCTSYTANLEMKRKGKMSKDEILKQITAIAYNNKELPFKFENVENILPAKSNMETIDKNYTNLAKKIGETGWTIPMLMSITYLENLINTPQTKEDFDKFFIEYYERCNLFNFNTMINHINKSKLEGSLNRLFNECVESYLRGSYLITVNSLVSLLEGALSKFDNDKKNIWMMKVCKNQLEKVNKENKPVKKLIWTSITNFITSLYTKSDFNKEEPLVINRHWILHGRSGQEWGKEDCLRLFNAIYTITSLMKYQK